MVPLKSGISIFFFFLNGKIFTKKVFYIAFMPWFDEFFTSSVNFKGTAFIWRYFFTCLQIWKNSKIRQNSHCATQPSTYFQVIIKIIADFLNNKQKSTTQCWINKKMPILLFPEGYSFQERKVNLNTMCKMKTMWNTYMI